VHGDGLTFARRDDPAALLGRLGARVLDDLVEELSRDPQSYLAR
jgi:hypothetical protein